MNWECGEIGRHDGLKIRCLVISVRVQVPPFPTLKNICPFGQDIRPNWLYKYFKTFCKDSRRLCK
jgi:hypothetical protein